MTNPKERTIRVNGIKARVIVPNSLMTKDNQTAKVDLDKCDIKYCSNTYTHRVNILDMCEFHYNLWKENESKALSTQKEQHDKEVEILKLLMIDNHEKLLINQEERLNEQHEAKLKEIEIIILRNTGDFEMESNSDKLQRVLELVRK